MTRREIKSHTWRVTGLAFGTAALLVAATTTADSQGLNLATGDPESPIQVLADNGIEWQQDNEVLIARGNARASRSGVTIVGDELRAYYKKKPEGGTDLTRLDAQGNVKISSSGQQAAGDNAVYDMEQAILVLTGKKVKFTAGADDITADQQIEYWEKRRMAVARGNAVARREGRTLRADVLVAFLERDNQGKTEVRRVQAFDNIVIATSQDTVRANKGVYNVRTGIATLTGNVRIVRGDNLLAGERAEINLNTGISRLLTAPGAQSGSGRVQGLLLPQRGPNGQNGTGR